MNYSCKIYSDTYFFVLQIELGIAVQSACERQSEAMRFLYPLDISIKEKIYAIAKSYGAVGVEYSDQVRYFLEEDSKAQIKYEIKQ